MSRRQRIRIPQRPLSYTFRGLYVGGPLDGQFAPPNAWPRHNLDGQAVSADTTEPHYVLRHGRTFNYEEPTVTDSLKRLHAMNEPDEEPPDPRKLAALVPRYGQPRYTTSTSTSVCHGIQDGLHGVSCHHEHDPDHVVGQLPTDWRTT